METRCNPFLINNCALFRVFSWRSQLLEKLDASAYSCEMLRLAVSFVTLSGEGSFLALLRCGRLASLSPLRLAPAFLVQEAQELARKT